MGRDPFRSFTLRYSLPHACLPRLSRLSGEILLLAEIGVVGASHATRLIVSPIENVRLQPAIAGDGFWNPFSFAFDVRLVGEEL